MAVYGHKTHATILPRALASSRAVEAWLVARLQSLFSLLSHRRFKIFQSSSYHYTWAYRLDVAPHISS